MTIFTNSSDLVQDPDTVPLEQIITDPGGSGHGSTTVMETGFLICRYFHVRTVIKLIF
jgi:hypothetical protein